MGLLSPRRRNWTQFYSPLNGDVADIVKYPPATFKGIVALQILNHPEVTRGIVARLTTYVLAHPLQDYYRGKLMIVGWIESGFGNDQRSDLTGGVTPVPISNTVVKPSRADGTAAGITLGTDSGSEARVGRLSAQADVVSVDAHYPGRLRLALKNEIKAKVAPN